MRMIPISDRQRPKRPHPRSAPNSSSNDYGNFGSVFALNTTTHDEAWKRRRPALPNNRSMRRDGP